MTYRREKHSLIDKIFAWCIGIILFIMMVAALEAIFITVVGMITNTNTWDRGWALVTTKPYIPGNTWQPAKLNFAQDAWVNNPKAWVKEHEDKYGCNSEPCFGSRDD